MWVTPEAEREERAGQQDPRQEEWNKREEAWNRREKVDKGNQDNLYYQMEANGRSLVHQVAQSPEMKKKNAE